MALAKGGHATLLRGRDKRAGVFTPLNENLMQVHRALKLAFDPKRLRKFFAAGAVLEDAAETHNWGRIAHLADPFGHGFCLTLKPVTRRTNHPRRRRGGTRRRGGR